MKKFVLILVVLLVSVLNGCAKDKNTRKQEFVNPIFNKPLFAYGRTSWNTLLTPKNISETPDNFSDEGAYIEKHNCKLLENENNHIKYICNICYPDLLMHDKINCSVKIIIYKITDNGFIEEQSFRPREQEPYSIDYLITKP